MSDFTCSNYSPRKSHWKYLEICRNTFDCNQGAIRAVRFNADGAYCITCGTDNKVKLWSPYRGNLLFSYFGHASEVLDAMGSCDSSKIISSSCDKSVILWDVCTGQALRRFRGHHGPVTCVAFNEDSSVAVSGSSDNNACCWDMRARQYDPVQMLTDARDCVTSVRFSDYEILTSSVDCRVRRYDMRNCKILTDFLGDSVTCANFTNDGQCILGSCADNTVRLMDKFSGQMLSEYKGHISQDIRVESAVNYNDTSVVSGSLNGDIFFWDLVTTQVTKKLVHTPGRAVQTLSLHPKDEKYLTASGTSVKFWTIDVTDQIPVASRKYLL